MVAVLGSTQDGRYDPIAEIAAALDRVAAAGGFVAPFLDVSTEWDFC